jgi:nucleoside recognition membrane protein YjiH
MDKNPEKVTKRKLSKGFLNPKIVRAVTFYIISACIIFSVAVCILAIWDYAKTDVFWRMIATLGVIAIGSAVFAFVNGIFGIDED